MSLMIDLEEDGTQALVAAIVRQATSDYLSHYSARRHPDAGQFLQAAGLIENEDLDRPRVDRRLIAFRRTMDGMIEPGRALRRAAKGSGLPKGGHRRAI
jgi:hypothetical protein